ncbi:conjugal transfer protein [Nocardiopsis tropica]|uniref:Conjugal transfer protein n=1 Tax=Nocardiopsis tropica TaxID=109330 RepID=A0ABU7KR38_9ACTN|nr:conjugal transfer protein [Nocardiopsis umidischolae]MEE2051760.1 conjugal transfer protein [Nocardiopsis umidischolae]
MSPKRSTGEAPEPRTGRRGSGGRWRVYLGRGVIWTFIGLVIVNAGTNQYRVWTADAAPAAQEETTADAAPAFPEDAAAAFAASFAEVYLQPAAPDAEADEQGAVLADFVPEDAAAEFALPEDFTGTRVRIVQVEATDDQHGLVTLSAQVNGEPMHLQVPVYADGAAALVVAGPPALLPAPAQAVLPEQSAPDTDSQTAEDMEPVVSGFLAAYAETPEHLERYAEPGAHIVPLPADVFEFVSVDALVVPPGQTGETHQVQATVTWQLAEGTEVDTLTQRYALTMVESAGAWYVRDIQGAAPVGADQS